MTMQRSGKTYTKKKTDAVAAFAGRISRVGKADCAVCFWKFDEQGQIAEDTIRESQLEINASYDVCRPHIKSLEKRIARACI